MRQRRVRVGSVVVAALALVSACSSDDSSSADDTAADQGSATTTTVARPADQRGDDVALPEVTGPVTGGETGEPFLAADPAILDQYGYTEAEFILEGDAVAFEPDGALSADGQWSVSPVGSAHFVTLRQDLAGSADATSLVVAGPPPTASCSLSDSHRSR